MPILPENLALPFELEDRDRPRRSAYPDCRAENGKPHPVTARPSC
jgi:hypothetical protein